MVTDFNRRTNIKIIHYDEDIISSLSSSSDHLLPQTISTSSSSSSTPTSSPSSSIIQNVTINYSHQDLQMFTNSLEIAIRIRPKDPKLKIHSVFIKLNKQYLLLTTTNFKETLENVLTNNSKIMMKIMVTEPEGEGQAGIMQRNSLKKRILEKQNSTQSLSSLVSSENTKLSSSKQSHLLKKKLSDDNLKISKKKLDESLKFSQILQTRRRSSTTEDSILTNQLRTPRRRSMTSFNEEGSKNIPPTTPSSSAASAVSAYPLSAIKYAPDGTKLAPNGGRLFRGGSNNIPKFDVLPTTNIDNSSNKENHNLERISPTTITTPTNPSSSLLGTEGSSSPSPSSSSRNNSPNPLIKKRRIGLQESTKSTNQTDPPLSPHHTTKIFPTDETENKRRRLSC